MSNSSERPSGTAAARDLQAAQLLAQALGGIADECSCLSLEIAELGGRLSEMEVGANKLVGVKEMQEFDRLTQNAHAQARLISYLARIVLGEAQIDRPGLVVQIDGVPLAEVRQRLKMAIGEQLEVDAADDDMFWEIEPEPGATQTGAA